MTVVPRPSTVSAVSTASSSRNDTESAVWPGVAITVIRRPAASITSPSVSGPPRPRRNPLPTERTTAPVRVDELVDAAGVVARACG